MLFARYPLPKSSQPDLPQPTNLLNTPKINRTRASSIELERKPELEFNDSTVAEKTSGSDFKASKGQKAQNTVPCVFKWTPKSAGALAKINSKENLMLNKVRIFRKKCYNISNDILFHFYISLCIMLLESKRHIANDF